MDDFYGMIYRECNDPIFILDIKTLRFTDANKAVTRLTGYSEKQLLAKKTLTDLTPAKFLPEVNQIIKLLQVGKISYKQYNFLVQTKSRVLVPVEAVLQIMKYNHNHEALVGYWHDATERIKFEEAANKKTEDLVVANRRVISLTEKIRSVPQLAVSLLKMPSEQVLVKKLCDTLVHRQKLNYEYAIVYLLEGNSLIHYFGRKGIIMPNRINLLDKISLGENHVFVRAYYHFAGLKNLLEKNDFIYKMDGHLIMPLVGRDKIVGLMILKSNEVETQLMESNETIKKGYYDVLKTLINSAGLAIENVRLTELLRVQTNRDSMTGVSSRRYFEDVLVDEFERALRYNRNLSLVLFDLNGFKQLNETYGHKQGDRVLIETAQLLKRNFRKVDSVCRYGGDEFAVILPETAEANAILKSKRMAKQIRNNRFSNISDPRKGLRIVVSFAVSYLADNIRTADDLMREAEKLLLKAKPKH